NEFIGGGLNNAIAQITCRGNWLEVSFVRHTRFSYDFMLIGKTSHKGSKISSSSSFQVKHSTCLSHCQARVEKNICIRPFFYKI
ncbi:MAG: hypothetical protein J6Q48_00790, partial [Bacteroidaceae bacterium]|nr:hypothetical protein [Bacteroidaceae bacterium]